MDRKRVSLILLICIMLLLPVNVWGADNYTHNANISRTNTVMDPSYSDLKYNNNPYYVQFPRHNGKAQYSNTTPAVVGSYAYQFSYDQAGKGYLTKIKLKKPDATWKPGNGINLDMTLIATFDEGTSGGRDAAAGISGPTIKDGYLAIAVGEYLYWWTIDGDGNQISDRMRSPIWGNDGNAIKLIASSPLITPPLTASGMSMLTGETVTWQTPFAVVGSWSGGVISQPLYTPDGVSRTNYGYRTTDDASRATNDIVTSSPAWNTGTTAVGGTGAAVFGVAAYSSGDNRLIIMNPTTGAVKTIRGFFEGPIDSSPVIAPNKHIFVPDHWGGIYRMNANGVFESKDLSAMDKTRSNISNIAIDGQNVIWIGNGHTTITVAPLSSFGSMRIRASRFSGLYSPAVVSNGATSTIFLASDTTNGLLVTNPITAANPSATFGDEFKPYWQTLGSVSATYTSVAANVGVDPVDGSDLHFICAWTNYGLNSQGCVEIWAPAEYTVKATAAPAIVNSGEQVIIKGLPFPEGLTQSIKAHITDGGENTIDLDLSQWSRSPETWQGVMNAPNNYTGADAVYTVTLTATQPSGKTATATTQFKVNPIPLPPPGELTGTLKLEAWRRNNTIQPKGPDGTPTAKYGNELAVTLTVDQPPPPKGLLNAQVTQAYLTKAWVHTPRGEIGWDASGKVGIHRSEKDIDLNLNGLVGGVKYTVDWAGYPPPIPDNTVMETNRIFAPFAVHVDYIYQIPVATELGVTYIWQSGSYEASGNAAALLDITGTDLYIYNVKIHDPGTPEWQP